MRQTVVILLSLLICGCAKENRWDCFKSYGDEVTETRSISAFDAVFIDQRVDFEYRYSDNYLVEVIFGENIIEHIKTKVEEGSLQITNDATCNWVRDLSKKPLVRVYAPRFSYMENRASGDIEFVDTLVTETFTYEQWESNGVTTLKLNNNLSQIIMHVGFTDVTVIGETDRAELYSAATGRLNARDLISPITLTNNSSIQDIQLFASEYLYGEINERGSIFYAGDPPEIDANVSGSGVLEPL